ncbi:MAG: hypothetical protein IJK40_01235 [Clostridia bacterium]|nr:hypothetical protein [Clostridia bacterium]
MAQCPKCGVTLRLTQWRQECPACGVNMIYYKSNDRLLAETEAAEIEHAKFQPSIDRAKAAFFGSPPAIARVVLSVLPLGALFLPLGTPNADSFPTGAVGLYNLISETGFGGILQEALAGKPLPIALICLLFSVLMVLVCLICLPMSLGPHGKLRNLIVNLLLTCPALAAAALTVTGGGRLGFGAYIYIGLCVAITVYNLILAKKGLPVKHTLCLIGGLPSDEYFAMVEAGVPDLEIRKKMVDALTVMQAEVRKKAAEEEAKAQAEREARK